jgi:stage V sporulation protein G
METTPDLKATVRLHHLVQGKRELLGFAELIIAGSFVIKDIAIVRATQEEHGSAQPFVSFPAKKGKGELAERYFNVAHPITADARKTAQNVVLEAFALALEKPGNA